MGSLIIIGGGLLDPDNAMPSKGDKNVNGFEYQVIEAIADGTYYYQTN